MAKAIGRLLYSYHYCNVMTPFQACVTRQFDDVSVTRNIWASAMRSTKWTKINQIITLLEQIQWKRFTVIYISKFTLETARFVATSQISNEILSSLNVMLHFHLQARPQ